MNLQQSQSPLPTLGGEIKEMFAGFANQNVNLSHIPYQIDEDDEVIFSSTRLTHLVDDNDRNGRFASIDEDYSA